MFEGQYWQLCQIADNLDQFQGYLDTEGLKQRDKVQRAYDQARNHLAYDLEKHCGDADSALSKLASDFAALRASEPQWAERIDLVQEDVAARIEQQRNKNPLLKKAVRFGGPILACVGLATYFGIWFYNDLTIDAPLETKSGLIQRAEAFDKAINYDDVRSGRGGIMRDILFAPIEPDEQELVAAQEFAGLVLEGYNRLASERKACGLVLAQDGQPLSKMELNLVSVVSAYVRDEQTVWQESPVETILPPVIKAQPCF